MTTPTDSADELARLVAECKKLGIELAHVYSFVGDDSMPIAKERFESAVDALAAYRTRPAQETAGEPEPVGHIHSNGDFCQDHNISSQTNWPVYLYTADQLRAHVAAERERWEAELARLRADNENLRSVMIAAAEEILEHWDAHCDADGYGPANLMHRLEAGIPSEYGYKAGDFARLRAEVEAVRGECKDLRFGLVSALTLAAQFAADEFKPEWLDWLGKTAEDMPDDLSCEQAIDAALTNRKD